MRGIKQLIFTIVLAVFSLSIYAEAATLRFYDENLSLIETRNYEEGTIIDFSAKSENKEVKSDNFNYCYLAGSPIPLGVHTITKNMNLYSVPMVKEIVAEYQLENIKDYLGNRYMLMADIKLTKAWLPIGSREKPFIGVFNGGGHKISGLWVDDTSCTDFIGLFGRTYGALISNISVSIDIDKGLSGRSHVGAIVGSAVNTKIINSYSDGLIKGEKLIGGIAGYVFNSMIKSSHSVCDIEASGGTGGIVGGAHYSYIENVHSSSTITIKDIGTEYLGQDIAIEKNNVTARNGFYERAMLNVNGLPILQVNGLAGGVTGYSYMSTITDGHFTGRINGRDHSGGIVGYMINDYSYYSGGIVNSSCSGSIDGRDYSGGIAGNIDGSVIINSNFNGSISGKDHSGGIVGNMSEGDIISSNFKGTIKGGKEVGGIAGHQERCALIADSYAQGEIDGENSVGGLVGYLEHSVIDLSHFSGSVKGVEFVGGIAGYSKGTITDSYSEGVIKGERNVGGIAGVLPREESESEESERYERNSILSSHSSADISGKENVGGIVGNSVVSYIGDVYFTGKVKGEGKYIGGIAGYNEGLIENGYVLGPVEGGEYTGGITGYSKSEGYEHNLAANSMIKGKNTARIVAFIDGEQKSIPNNFALSTLGKGFTKFSEGDARNGTSKTAEELKKKETYSSAPPNGLGWKFGDNNLEPWTMTGSTTGYPILYWQIRKTGYGRGWYCEIDD
jgi:hypothetical protein